MFETKRERVTFSKIAVTITSAKSGVFGDMDGREENASFSTSPSSFVNMNKSFHQHTDSARLQFYKQQTAWWKSQYMAAQYENKVLRAALDQVYSAPLCGRSSIQCLPKRKKNHKNKRRVKTESIRNNSNSDDCEEFEISEEFRQFLDVNRQYKEKREIEKAIEREARGSESESERVERMEQDPSSASDYSRQEQLKLLYGKEWRIIQGLETQVQMNYDQFSDTNKPGYWPNIPMNL